MHERTARVALGSGLTAVAALLVTRTSRGRRLSRAGRRRIGRRLHGIPGKLRGLDYQLRRRHPDDTVSDLVLADRIRSSIGPLQKELDLPHIHVMVSDGVAMLHGEVTSQHDSERLISKIGDVAGVHGVESFLHVGLLPSDTRPSAGRAEPPPLSAAYQQLAATAVRAGSPVDPSSMLRAVLGTFCDQIPPDERAHVLGHLPEDVRLLAERPVRRGVERDRIRRTHDLYEAIAGAHHPLDVPTAQAVTREVLIDLARLVPEECQDIAATLPEELRELWTDSWAAATSSPAMTVGEIELLEQS